MREIKKKMTTEKIETTSAPVKTTVATKPTRNKRIPLNGTRTKLGIDKKIEGYHLHWINDTVGRLYDAEQGGYEFVSPSEVGASDEGNRVKRRVGVNEDNTPLFAYLMKIREDWWLEDQAESQKLPDQFDELVRGGNTEAFKNKYVPSSGIKLSRN